MVLDMGAEQKHMAMHAFCYRPNVRFEEQQEGEEVILVLRAHPVTQLHWVIISIVLSLLPLLALVILVQFVSIVQVIFFFLFWYSFIFSYVFLNIINWVFNVGIITDKRVVDIDFSLILKKEVTGSPLDDITDITIKSTGFFPSIIGYGDVFIQTPGAMQNIEFYAVPHPGTVVTIVNKLMEGHR